MGEKGATGKGSVGEEVVLDLPQGVDCSIAVIADTIYPSIWRWNGVISAAHLTGASARRGLCHRWSACGHIASLPVNNVLYSRPSFLVFI